MENQTESSGGRDVLIQLSSFVVLYLVSSAFVSLVFGILNNYLPDAADWMESFSVVAVAWEISMLVVFAPALVVLFWLRYREYVRFPERVSSRFRKWLIYLTITLAAAMIMGTLVYVIYNFLLGSLALRALLKVATLLVVGAVVIGYLIFDLRRTDFHANHSLRVGITVGSIFLLAVLVIGFLSIGSPWTRRTQNFDDQRVSDLDGLDSEIKYFAEVHHNLPTDLEEIEYDSYNTDPETGKLYDYQITSTSTYQLCANFSLPSSDQNEELDFLNQRTDRNSWRHDAGYKCFDLKTDSN